MTKDKSKSAKTLQSAKRAKRPKLNARKSGSGTARTSARTATTGKSGQRLRSAAAAKGTFDWALSKLRGGKKVRRKEWLEDAFIYLEPYFGTNTFVDSRSGVINIHGRLYYADLVATDWEVVR